jgi:hypothetical protein
MYHAGARLCAVCALTGDWPGAYGCARELADARRTGALPLTPADLAYYLETAAWMHAGQAARAEEELRRFEVRAGANRRYRIPYLVACAILAQGQANLDVAIAYLEAVRPLIQDIDLPGELWPVEATLAGLCRTLGLAEQAEKAKDAQARSDATLHKLADGFTDPTLRATFLAAAPHVVQALRVSPLQ